jgi:hypothetical protein
MKESKPRIVDIASGHLLEQFNMPPLQAAAPLVTEAFGRTPIRCRNHASAAHKTEHLSRWLHEVPAGDVMLNVTSFERKSRNEPSRLALDILAPCLAVCPQGVPPLLCRPTPTIKPPCPLKLLIVPVIRTGSKQLSIQFSDPPLIAVTGKDERDEILGLIHLRSLTVRLHDGHQSL